MSQRLFAARQGFVLITVLLVLAVVSVVSVAALDQTTSSLKTAVRVAEEEQALYAANAGVEHAVAYLQAGRSVPFGPSTFTLPTASKPVSYTITITPTANPNAVNVVSIGSAGSSQRTVAAGMSSNAPVGYYKAIYGLTSITLSGNAQICGDIYAVGFIWFQSNVHILKDNGTTCNNNSAGTAIATGLIWNSGGAIVDGGYCSWLINLDQPPCNGTVPQVIAPPAFDYSHNNPLYTQAVAQGHYRNRNATLSAGSYGSSSGDVWWIDGDLQLNGVTIAGKVTFVAMDSQRGNDSGAITFSGNVTGTNCGLTNPCPAAFIAQGDINLGSRHEIWGGLITTSGTVSATDRVTIHGGIVANTVSLGTNAWLYADNPYYQTPPPGLPPFGNGVAISSWLEQP